jgi:translocation and assembly module TamA
MSATPFVSVLGTSVEMLAMRATESFYVPLTATHREIWATRMSLGSIVGPSRSAIPADKRFYAGGGDSVRGYKYQFVGDLVNVQQPVCIPTPTATCDADTTCDPSKENCEVPHWKPKGGRSLLQVGTELRWKITDHFGLVPFVEGAGVYQANFPDFSQDFEWAAGLGMRYFTVAGPIRLDLGFPLNPRQADSVFEIYISLGQAF